jgi:hypothetical protein
MSVEAWTRTPQYTIAGIGPYQITHPYAQGAIRVSVMLDTGLLDLGGTDVTITPPTSATTGDVYLSPTAAATHAGRPLIIDRVTPDEQGWLAVQGEREAGLAAQLDRMVQANQELRALVLGSIRIRGALDAFDWPDGTIPLRDGGRVVAGPTADAVAEAQENAVNAAASALAAAASAASALAKENSMLRWRGAWATATTYSPSDIAHFNGSAYICLVAHTSGVFATDLAAARWEVFVEKGASGTGSGDMNNADNLSGLTDKPLALATIGGQAASAKLSSLAELAIVAGDLIIGAVGGLVGRLGIGANGKILGIVAGALAWVDQILPAAVTGTEFVTWNGTRCTFAHGLGRYPRQVRWYLQCTTATQGYSIGDRLSWGSGQSYGTSQNGGAAYENTTEVSMYASDVTGRHKTTNAGFQLTTSANWKLVVEVW